MTSRKTVGVIAFLIPLAMEAIAAGWMPLFLQVSGTVFGLMPALGGVAGLAAGPLVDS